jgi:hypothetical protein
MNISTKTIVEVLWYFLPALLANASPGIAANKLYLPLMRVPVWERLLGKNKTIGAYYVCPIVAVITIYAQWTMGRILPAVHEIELFTYDPTVLWLIGSAFGLGAILGDHVESAGKRAIGISAGRPLPFFDQFDFMPIALLMALPLTGWIGWERVAALVICFVPIYVIGNYIGWHFGHRKTWY